jgi:hypothetical protein
MNCLECPRKSDCHNEIVNDISIVNTALDGVNKGHLMIAIESMEILQKRFEKRMLVRSGRIEE